MVRKPSIAQLLFTLCWALILPIGCVMPTASLAETRVALIIGNSKYAQPLKMLPNVPHDAAVIAWALHNRARFETVLVENANQASLDAGIEKFVDMVAAGQDTVALVYYAGHGVQDGVTNYLLPIDADLLNGLPEGLSSVNALMARLDRAGARLQVIILDACRTAMPVRTTGTGLAVLEPKKARDLLIAFSTAPGQPATDGLGDNSPYAAALANEIMTPGYSVEDAFKRVNAYVLDKTESKQRPWLQSSLTVNFYFVGSGGDVKPSPSQSSEPGTLDPDKAFNDAVLIDTYEQYDALLKTYPQHPKRKTIAALMDRKSEESLWRQAENASATDDKINLYHRIVWAFPDGVYHELAQDRIKGLLSPVAPPPLPLLAVSKLDDTDLYGGDLNPSGVTAKDFDGCAAICTNNAQCSAFTFNARYNVCFPKSGKFERKPWPQALSGIVSSRGGIVPQAPPKVQVFNTLTGFDLPGADMVPQGTGAASARECEAQCRNQPGCRAYTFNTQFNKCFVKSAASRQVAYSNAVSGMLSDLTEGRSFPRAPSVRIDVQRGWDYQYGDYKDVKDVGEDECVSICQADSHCLAMSYIPAQQSCWLKDNVNGPYQKAGVVGGLKLKVN